ncbi:DUF3995 domain-containing protein [uncultured Roseibium sp.]|uniref:DUF3995 domain-containing protein n=1 Tax=uncultured Roseibium sp. TaxID=1936171 RepID=UPI002632287A|nr:DUF3995 domain-containing protein [uncultured Roseibium sp.]
MTSGLALIVAAILAPIAGLHFLWALGTPWPFNSERLLAQAVGGPGLDPKIGPTAKCVVTIVAAGAILISAILPLFYARVLPSPLPYQLVFWLLAVQTAVFLLRGCLGYMSLSAMPQIEPFRTYNRRFFNPLIIALGLACAVILLAD